MSSTGSALQAAVLNSTNYYRTQHQARPVTWNATLASYASNYAQQCIFYHSHGPYGENLAEGYPAVSLAIDAWAAEERLYNYATAHFSETTGHYTQLVWKGTTAVGCAAVQCSSDGPNGAKGPYLVCEYSPPGNVAGQFRQSVGKTGEGRDGMLGLGSGNAAARGASAAERMLRWLVVGWLLVVGVYS